jgi:SAM-dependent methyltransferase
MKTFRDGVMETIEYWTTQMEMDRVKNVLEIGIAGDPKPGGNFYLFKDKNYKTLDIDVRYEADYTDDIQNIKNVPLGYWDVVILSQVIEHLTEPIDAILNSFLLLKPKGYLIVDCPWMLPYHPDDGFDDYWRISASGLEYLLKAKDWEIIGIKQTEQLSSALVRKNENNLILSS